jgi:hypothetical protein
MVSTHVSVPALCDNAMLVNKIFKVTPVYPIFPRLPQQLIRPGNHGISQALSGMPFPHTEVGFPLLL